MAHTAVSQEEDPDKDDAWLVEHYRVCRWGDLRDIGWETVTHARGYKETHSVEGDIGAGTRLTEGHKDVVVMAKGRVTLSTLIWAHEELSWDKHHQGQHYTENSFPAHHVERLLVRRILKDVLLGNRVESLEELTTDKHEHSEDHLLPLISSLTLMNLCSFGHGIGVCTMMSAFVSFTFKNVKECDLEKAAHDEQERHVLEPSVGLAEDSHWENDYKDHA